MTDLVRRLRRHQQMAGGIYGESIAHAADAIERLTAERDMLVDALKMIRYDKDVDTMALCMEVASDALAEVKKTK